MITPSSDCCEDLEALVAHATDQFLEKVQAGEQPDVPKFARQYPGITRILVDLLPAIGQVGPRSEPRTTANLTGTLGDFRIIRELGRGGMGIVYEAEQISLGRRVALKTLPFASAIDPVRLNRFRNEAQAAAQLHHRNILPVYAVGSDRGVWYYAMQIVDGRSLCEAIHEFRVGDQSEALSQICPNPKTAPMLSGDEKTRETPAKIGNTSSFTRTICEVEGRFQKVVVELCLQAAQALQHAHSMDIVHRDIKPANLMIDNSGHLWVTDFGLARVRNNTAVTQTGDVIGTLAYMSPEQAMGDRAVVDHRSDIYSLGATLYELLTLRRPFEEDNKAALVRRITTEQPVSPRSLNATIPFDLETIVMKCLAPDPKDRYLSATALAEDFSAFLADKQIKARRPTFGERLARWARRHRPLVTIAAVACMLMVLGLGAATALIAREQSRTAEALQEVSQRERDLRLVLASQERQRQKAEANLRRAEENFQQSRDVLDSFISAVESDVGPDESLRRELLEKSLAYYQDFVNQAEDNRPLQVQLARSHRRVARILFEIGTTEEAQAALEKALQLQEQLVRESPRDLKLRRSLQAMYERLGTNSENRLVKLLGEKSVQREIGLTPEQVRDAELIVADYFEFDGRIDRHNPTAIRQHVGRRVDEAVALIEPLLTGNQFERLRQIELQLRDLNVWYDPGFNESVGLRTDQRAQIQALVSSSNHEIREAFRNHRADTVAHIREAFSEAILLELDDDQVTRHNRLLGYPFTEPVRHQGLPWQHPTTRRRGDRPRQP